MQIAGGFAGNDVHFHGAAWKDGESWQTKPTTWRVPGRIQNPIAKEKCNLCLPSIWNGLASHLARDYWLEAGENMK
jgi:hypothetical protein